MSTNAPKPRSANDLVRSYSKLGIPHFQRGLVWTDEGVSLLLESLYWRTPCGNIILWRSNAPREHGAPLVKDCACKLLIVDGQQRIRMLYEAFHNARPDGKYWCLDLTLEPSFSGLIAGETRSHLFVATTDPLNTKNPRYKHNLIPLREMTNTDVDSLRSRYVKPENGVTDAQINDALTAAKQRVAAMWRHRLFSVIKLGETDGYGIGEVVSLYNRINSAGRRVEAEEIAYATLVRIYPATTNCLREFFQTVHGNKEASRDDLLRHEKERSFGFKLYLRTFVQVCNYHFARSSGTQGFSFDVVGSPELSRWFAAHQQEAGKLFQRTLIVLDAVRRILREVLHCDDLRMLPDSDCLTPALQLLIRYYPELLSPAHERAIAYLILRQALEPNRNTRLTLNLLRDIDRSHTIQECFDGLSRGDLAWNPLQSKELKTALKSANTLSDRYVLLLYWLIRKNQAWDFSYKNLPENKQVRPPPGTEAFVSENAEPEKQHIIPASVLGHAIYGNAGRIATSRHEANNVGNLTFISHKLNHFVTGLGDRWIDPAHDDASNLAAHFMTKKVLASYESLRKRELSPSDESRFEKFCKLRRDEIQAAFVEWMNELRAGLLSVTNRITPERRIVNPDTPDDIRNLRFPIQIEDLLIKLQVGWKRWAPSQEKHKGGRAALVFNVPGTEGTARKKLRIYVFAHPPRIEIENRPGHAVFDVLRAIMVRRQQGPDHGEGERWVLSCSPKDEESTASILNAFLGQLD